MRAIRALVAIVLWTIVALCLAATIVPPFLDRIYYRGPASGHFDGRHFFNPRADDGLPSQTMRGNPANFMLRHLLRGSERAGWPEHVSVVQSRPPARVDGASMRATWVGHATLLVQTQGLNILTDPVWSERTGPFGIGPRRVAEPGVRFADLPRIDIVLVSHNHYDHLDLRTLKRLWDRDRPLIVTSLGNDTLLAGAGVPSRALDWGQRIAVRDGIAVAVTRNHHWSSRWFVDRNRALWSSFVVQLPGGNFFFAGDTGSGDLRWPGEAAALGPIRLAAIPIGAFRFQPGQMTADSHIGPRDAVHVWGALGAPFAIPIHWGTFQLSSEAYSTPPDMLRAALRCAGVAPQRFAARPIGRTIAVPQLAGSAPPADFAALARCEREGRFDRFR